MTNVVLKWSFLENLRNFIIETNGIPVDKTSDIERPKCQNATIALSVKKKTLPTQGKIDDVAKMKDAIKNFTVDQDDAAIRRPNIISLPGTCPSNQVGNLKQFEADLINFIQNWHASSTPYQDTHQPGSPRDNPDSDLSTEKKKICRRSCFG